MQLEVIAIAVYILVIIFDLVPLFKSKDYKSFGVSVFLICAAFAVQMLSNEYMYRGKIASIIMDFISYALNK